MSQQDVQKALKEARDCPIWDSRRWYQDLYEKHGMLWPGKKPGPYSPRNRKEEQEIQKQLLEGTLVPRNKSEREFLEAFGGKPIPVADRPQMWIKCLRCHIEFKATGYPSLARGASRFGLSDQQVAGYPGRWLFPSLCDPCGEATEASKDFYPLPARERNRDYGYAE